VINRKTILKTLPRERLVEIARALGQWVLAQSSHELIDVILQTRTTSAQLLGMLSRAELKALCTTTGRSPKGREKQVIIDRLLGRHERASTAEGTGGSQPSMASQEFPEPRPAWSRPDDREFRGTVEGFGLLSDGTRFGILQLLADGPRNVTALCEALDLKQPTVSHHLGLLRAGGLVRSTRDGKSVVYASDQEAILALSRALARLRRIPGAAGAGGNRSATPVDRKDAQGNEGCAEGGERLGLPQV